MSFCEWTRLRGGIVTSRRDIGRTSFLFFFISSSFFCWLLFCWGWQLSGRVFWLWQTALIYSVPVGGLYCIYNLYFVRLLVVENRVCCENSGMTARLSVARSVSVLTAIVTVVSDSPASSIPFYIQCQRFFELLPTTY